MKHKRNTIGTITRNQSYRHIQADVAKLNGLHLTIYLGIKNYAPVSRRELSRKMGLEINIITARVSEMLNMPVPPISELGVKTDPDTNRPVALLGITDGTLFGNQK